MGTGLFRQTDNVGLHYYFSDVNKDLTFKAKDKDQILKAKTRTRTRHSRSKDQDKD